MGWVECNHKTVLETGDYVIRLRNQYGHDSNVFFKVSAWQKKAEIEYFYDIAYFKVTEYGS